MVVGAYSVNVKDNEVISRIRDVGRFVGIAFQVRDDVIDYLNIDSRNPGGVNTDEINIVRIMSKGNGDVRSAIDKARGGLLNEMLDNAVKVVREVVNNEVLVNYINLLRI
ncbi:polyprenyl synthetase family protein [Vulcanisaeta distributa]|uniref:polyprenyl synthetase family protein n=1 Tax=Vulcanisaeta distributa TaxID=164451 RepID=UPI000AC0DBC7|nr:polyprenyl synthetase family protein [Vulcanisaeta distributa]